MPDLDTFLDPTASRARIEATGQWFPRGAALLSRLLTRLAELNAERSNDPVLNPVERLAYELSRDIDADTVSPNDLDELVRTLTLSAYLSRAGRLEHYVGSVDVETSKGRARRAIRNTIENGSTDGAPIAFDTFRQFVEHPAIGVVFTAHPTFAVPEPLMTGIANLAAGSDSSGEVLDEARRTALIDAAAHESHGHAQPPTLREEQAAAARAIGRFREALDQIQRIVLEEARSAFPEQWTELAPQLATVACWAGYDLDGRADIGWADVLRARVDSAARQASHYAARFAALAAVVSGDAQTELAALADSAKKSADWSDALSHMLAAASQDIDAAREVGQRLADSGRPLFDTVAAAGDLARLTPALDEAAQIEAQLARAELLGFGLGEAHIHLRINASQLDNALRNEVDRDGFAAGASVRRRIAHLNALLDDVKPSVINVGSVVVEPTTARRMFMLASLIRRYVDANQPIRFLIAECEHPFSVLAALYLARLFGVDDILDISPLFETQAALQRGHELIAELLENPHYRDYVSRRKRLAVQTGYSDGGRAIGQTSVSLAIERLRIKIAQILADAGIDGVELVVFDTHGESVGRGAHPGSLAARFDYIDTPHSRRVFADLGIRQVQELSYQGGDGYVFFGHPDLALSTLATMIEHRWTPAPAALDPFYADVDYALEVFLDMRAFNEGLAADANYAHWLSMFATSILYPTGSRAISRQREEHASVFDMRAIPHNALLQQLGMLVNSTAGVGASLAIDPERAAAMYQGSPRFRSLIDLVTWARGRSSIDAMGAYVDMLNPEKWLRRAAVEEEAGGRGERMRRVAQLLSRHGHYREANTFMHRVFDDILDLDFVLAACGIDTALHAVDVELDIMHAVRLTLVRRVLLLAADVPTFTSHSVAEQRAVERDLVTLDVPEAVASLREIFPESPAIVVDESFGAAATYRNDAQLGYHSLHETVFRPLETHHELLRCIGAAITHQIGAFG